MRCLSAIDGKIVEKDLHEGQDVIVANFDDDTLECGRCRRQSEHHYDCHKNTPFCDKCCLLFVVGVHADLIIPAKSVQKNIALMPCHTIHKRERKYVCDGRGVQLSVVDANPDLSVFLWDDHDRA